MDKISVLLFIIVIVVDRLTTFYYLNMHGDLTKWGVILDVLFYGYVIYYLAKAYLK